MGDAIRMTRKNKNTEESYRCMRKILPNDQANILWDAKKTFDKLCSKQELLSGKIGMGSFAKLAKQGIKDRTTLELLYRKVCGKAPMDFDLYLDALEQVGSLFELVP